MSDEVFTYHPVDPVAASDPFPALAQLRDRCPISKPEYRGYPPLTLLTRYDDAVSVLRNYRTFQNIGIALSKQEADAVPLEKRHHIALNPPHHTDVRRLLMTALAPPVIKEAIPQMTVFAREVVDAFASRGSADLVHDWAARFPAAAIVAVLGLPLADADMIHRWIDDEFDLRLRRAEEDCASITTATSTSYDWGSYLAEHIESKRKAGTDVDDGITRMVRYKSRSGRAFNDEELVTHIHSVLVAGNRTTQALMSNLMHRVLVMPGLFERIQDDRSLIEPLIEESLRVDPPIMSLNRACAHDTTIGDEQLVEDDIVCASLASANRDEAIWGSDSEEFRLERFVDSPPRDHLAFGLGIHLCPGAFMARVGARIATEALLDRTRRMRLPSDYQYEKVHFYLSRRPVTLPVEFEHHSC